MRVPGVIAPKLGQWSGMSRGSYKLRTTKFVGTCHAIVHKVGGRIQLRSVHRAQVLDLIRCSTQKGCLSLKNLFEGKSWKAAHVFDVFTEHSIISCHGKRVRRASLSRILPRPVTVNVVQEELAFCSEQRCVPGQRLSKPPVMSRLRTPCEIL